MRTLLPLLTLVTGMAVAGPVGFLFGRASPTQPSAAPADVARADLASAEVVTADVASESEPARQELTEYLDGKTVALSGPQGDAARPDQLHTLEPKRFEAVQLQRGSKLNDEPWTTLVSLITDTGQGRYAVEVSVQHRLVEGRRVFYGYEVRRAVKQ